MALHDSERRNAGAGATIHVENDERHAVIFAERYAQASAGAARTSRGGATMIPCTAFDWRDRRSRI